MLKHKKSFLMIIILIFNFSNNFCFLDTNSDKKNKNNLFLLLGAYIIANNNSLIGMSDAYFNHTATLLNDGNVIVRGNSNAELYDVSTNSFSQITTGLSNRIYHTATLLESGKILITGGTTKDGSVISYNTSERYDPSTNSFTNTNNMNSARYLHTATLLNDGRVLITGGIDNNLNTLSSAEIYDPNTDSFTTISNMNYTRIGHTATLKSDGNVIIIGGFDSYNIPHAIVEIYNNSTETFSMYSSSSNYLTFARGSHESTILNNDEILITGGLIGNVNLTSNYNTETYNSTNLTSYVKGRMSTPRTEHTATLLQNGKVLVTGGRNYELYNDSYLNLPSIETYDPTEETFKNAGNMLETRSFHTATLLNNGKVLITGGMDSSRKNAEIYSP